MRLVGLGGTPLVEANRVGCNIVGWDINPMAYWVVHQEIEHLDLDAYRRAAGKLVDFLEEWVGRFYRTRCLVCGSLEADVKYFLWVKEKGCSHCGKSFPLFPGYLVSEDRRHPKNVFVCAACGELTEISDRKNPGRIEAIRRNYRASKSLPASPAAASRCAGKT